MFSGVGTFLIKRYMYKNKMRCASLRFDFLSLIGCLMSHATRVKLYTIASCHLRTIDDIGFEQPMDDLSSSIVHI